MTEDVANGHLSGTDSDPIGTGTPTFTAPAQEPTPPPWHEITAVLALVLLGDITLYRSEGFAGCALFFFVAPALLAWGARRSHWRRGTVWLVGAMLVLLAARLLWLGSGILVVSGAALLVAFAMTLSGLCPYVLETIVFASQTVLAGHEGLRQYRSIRIRRLYLFAITPVDAIVVRYNVWRILGGDPAPSVEISVHPINAEGVLYLQPLLDCDNEIIREGARALLAQHHQQAEERAQRRQQEGWSSFQYAEHIMLTGLRAASNEWEIYKQHDQRRAALKRFRDYAYQWY